MRLTIVSYFGTRPALPQEILTLNRPKIKGFRQNFHFPLETTNLLSL